MERVLGIDIGGSTTKVVILQLEGHAGAPMLLSCHQAARKPGSPTAQQATDEARHALRTCGVEPDELDGVALTGVGAPEMPGVLFGRPASVVPEFSAVAAGGMALAYPQAQGPEDALVVSAGTGVALVRTCGGRAVHLGGSGVGGKFLTGMGLMLLGADDARVIAELAARGDRSKVDLQVGDLCAEEIPGLPASLTAANFGKACLGARREDVACALVNVVFETIGMMAVFACKASGMRDVVLTGTLATLPGMREVARTLADLHRLRFTIPERAPFATAAGAALGAAREHV